MNIELPLGSALRRVKDLALDRKAYATHKTWELAEIPALSMGLNPKYFNHHYCDTSDSSIVRDSKYGSWPADLVAQYHQIEQIIDRWDLKSINAPSSKYSKRYNPDDVLNWFEKHDYLFDEELRALTIKHGNAIDHKKRCEELEAKLAQHADPCPDAVYHQSVAQKRVDYPLDIQKYGIAETWQRIELPALSMGLNPEYVTRYSVNRGEWDENIRREIEKRADLIDRSTTLRSLTPESESNLLTGMKYTRYLNVYERRSHPNHSLYDPEQVISWFEQNGLSFHKELVTFRKKSGGYVDYRKLYQTEIKAASEKQKPSTKKPPADQLIENADSRIVKSLYKIIYIFSQSDAYKYDPVKRNDAVGMIKTKADNLGVEISNDAIRKHLKSAFDENHRG